MNKKTARVTITLNQRNFNCHVEYDTLENLVFSINEFLSEFSEPCEAGDTTTIRLPECDGGKTYKWNVTYAHYCFGKGRISETELVNEIFKEENAV